jgi:alpha-mannosidase
MHKDTNNVQRRIKRFMDQRLEPALYRDRHPLELSYWIVPDEPVPFDSAVQNGFLPTGVGLKWGKPWGTTWFHVTGEVPESWGSQQDVQLELEVDLGFSFTQPGFQAEALVYTKNGTVIKGIHPRNRSVTLSVKAGESIELYLEAASNPDVARDWSFRPTEMGDKATAGNGPLYELKRVDFALLDILVYHLIHDFKVLYELMLELPAALPRKHEIVRGLEAAVDILLPEDVSRNANLARQLLKPLLDSPAFSSAHSLHAVGHSHIDSAWLWPLRETRRKVARTFSNALNLIEQNSSFIFAASSAQQYKWIKQDHPELFERVRSAVASGRFVPVGGMWIEPDSNIPSGESLIRQLLEGKRFFMAEFGIEPLDVWLPDSFGYNGAFPQIAKHGGSEYFLTQKISWNDTNVFPHHTFLWEGIDGTQIFTHFPPAATYNSNISGAELHLAESEFRERGKTNTSLLPFGWGNGGGGPTRDMLEAAERTRNLEGSPRVILSSPEKFFQAAIKEYPKPPVWVGELYLEFHRATATTQAPLKRGNRLSESLMREVELWSATAAIRKGYEYPTEEIRDIWEDILLLQFHDILPGTSITWVHREAAEMYADIEKRANALIAEALEVLCGKGAKTLSLNSGPLEVSGIAALGAGAPESRSKAAASKTATGGVLLDNEFLSIRFESDGTIGSAFDKNVSRELVPAGKAWNLFQLHNDFPSQWDAWDVESSYRHTVEDLLEIDALEIISAKNSSGVVITRSFGKSKISQTITMDASSADIDIAVTVDWHESEKFLKLAFPFALHTDRAASEIQYGHLHRMIHTNTGWDAARFETVAHRWVQLAEPNYGIAIANSSTYGHDITREVIDGASSATVRLSILRAPNFPDPTSDRGQHSFAFKIRPGANIRGAIAAGYELNSPLRVVDGCLESKIEPLLEIHPSSVLVESVKLADDASGDLVIRLYESEGIRSQFEAMVNFPASRVQLTDALERPISNSVAVFVDSIKIEFTPFQLKTLRFCRS